LIGVGEVVADKQSGEHQDRIGDGGFSCPAAALRDGSSRRINLVASGSTADMLAARLPKSWQYRQGHATPSALELVPD
jgi:hypothetical protein